MNDKIADYLAQEYLFLQKTVEDFDGRALTVKAWSVTFSAAGLGFAYQQHNRALLMVASGSALVFWLIEVVLKFHQRAYYPRICVIEEWFAEFARETEVAPFQISREWTSELPSGEFGELYRSGFGVWPLGLFERSERPTPAAAVPFLLGVMMPHIVVLITGLVLYFWGPSV